MDWLSTALWNLCMSMLPHRNTRALLVPVLCVVLLVPLAAASTLSTATAGSKWLVEASSEFVHDSSATVITAVPSAAGEEGQEAVTRSLRELSYQTATAKAHPRGIVPEQTAIDIDADFVFGTASVTAPMAHSTASTPDTKSRKSPQAQRAQQKPKGVVFLERDGSAVVPRKFTIPEPSIVAEADGKHIAILPGKPQAAAGSRAGAASGRRLMRRELADELGVALEDTMVVVTVDGRVHGISRSDGSVLWQRSSLLVDSQQSAHNQTGPSGANSALRGMVWTHGRPIDNEVCDRLQGQSGPDSADSSQPASAAEMDDEDEYDDEASDEEWLLEQGIDWRSDPLELQAIQRRRALMQWQKSRAQKSSSAGYSNAAAPASVLYIAEPGGGGALYAYTMAFGLQRLPLTIAQIVEKSPVQMRDVLYTGSKQASFAMLDMSTGRLHSVDVNGGDVAGTATRVLLGETLHRVRIIPTGSDAAGTAQLEWELFHRALVLPQSNPDVDALLSDISDAAEASRLGAPAKFVTTQEGALIQVEATTGMPLWAQTLGAPVIGMFDVFSLNNGARLVARQHDLGPIQQQRRFRQWLERSGEDYHTHTFWERGGSAGGNVLANAFWERTNPATGTRPQSAYVGRLHDTLYTLTSDAFPLIDTAALTSSLLLALGQARRDRDNYTALQHAEWWDRWAFLARGSTVIERVLREARAQWLDESSAVDPGADADADARFEYLADAVERHHVEEAIAAAADAAHADARGEITGVHAVGNKFATPFLDMPQRAEIGDDDTGDVDEGVLSDWDSESQSDPESRSERPWWRHVGHYVTRVAAAIGFIVTFIVFAAYVGVMYLLKPRNKRRARMWVDAAGDVPVAAGRRARLRISWALMHRMWATMKEEWNLAIEEAWRNPNAAAVLRRTGVQRRASAELRTKAEGEAAESQENSRTQAQAQAQAQAKSQSPEGNADAEDDANAEAEAMAGAGAGLSSSSSMHGGSVYAGSAHASDHSSPSAPSPLSRRNSTGSAPPAMTPLRPSQSQSALVLSDQVLGYGSHGTVVYRGTFQGRAVAVKRLLLDFYDVADHEVHVLQQSDTHPNVIRYYCTERKGHFMYIALELCCGSLADAIMRSPKAPLATQLLSQMPRMHILRQLARGLHHLHALKLVHRDIKPQNILVAPPPHRRRIGAGGAPLGSEDDALMGFGNPAAFVAGVGEPRVLISDFGLSRILDDDESSFANTHTMHGMPMAAAAAPGAYPMGMVGGFGGGTVGWRAPECFDLPEHLEVAERFETSDEPSPYVSRGTRSRLRRLAKPVLPEANADEPDSAGLRENDSASSLPFATAAVGSRRRMTRAVDIFSMGCVFYYILTDGEHPFGDRLTREQRILSGAPDLHTLESSDTPSAIEAVDLIAHMVTRQARDRPSTASVLVHPYFWDAAQRLAFLQDVSDCLEAEARLIKAARETVPDVPPSVKKKGSTKKKAGQQSAEPGSDQQQQQQPPPTGSHAISNESIESIIAQLPVAQAAAVRRAIVLLDAFEENSTFVMDSAPAPADGFHVVGMPASHSQAVDAMAEAVDGTGTGTGTGAGTGRRPPRRAMWDRRLDSHLRRDLGKFRKYDGTRLRDLLRVIRNKKNHYQDMPPGLRAALGDIPEGYLHYFDSRFPYLLLHCYYFILEEDSLRTATVFRPYFRPPTSM
ncbi:bifunctional endoribonuclease/protein kinase ire1 [Coemansia sp. Benny D115]|nr:bifunctional endoribonuclease/protein kinase ire1 [Coemansia sp. Benny D115]